MYKLQLYTLEKDMLRFVAEFDVAAFDRQPKVIIWGSRAFTWNMYMGKYVEERTYHIMQH